MSKTKNYPKGGPFERIERRWEKFTTMVDAVNTRYPVTSTELLKGLEELDNYYRERLDRIEVKQIELNDHITNIASALKEIQVLLVGAGIAVEKEEVTSGTPD